MLQTGQPGAGFWYGAHTKGLTDLRVRSARFCRLLYKSFNLGPDFEADRHLVTASAISVA